MSCKMHMEHIWFAKTTIKDMIQKNLTRQIQSHQLPHPKPRVQHLGNGLRCWKMALRSS
ncbi:protein P'2 [Hapavirus ngaingan]|uniref:Protein P'2 n=1 Tax=Hapavirus ngaingan TaxID=1972623 RepID=D3GGL1_9RHAB|nr:protein P'2 [Hapavirus ngaingan]ACX83602.1 protein P'2 [Hapavirus ngaingan]